MGESAVWARVFGRVENGIGVSGRVESPLGTVIPMTRALQEYSDSALVEFLGRPEWQGHLISGVSFGDPFVSPVFDPAEVTVEVPIALWRQLSE
jgi:hypothetical protein